MKKYKWTKSQKVVGTICLVIAVLILVVAITKRNMGSFLSSFLLLIIGLFMVEMKVEEFNSPFAYVMMVLLLLPFYILLMITSFKTKTNIWFDSLKLDQWISLYGSFLAYAGTVFLGFITIYQNKRITDITEKSVNGELKDKRGFLLPRVYEIKDNKEIEKSYDITKSGICFYNAGNDYINELKLIDYSIDNSEKLHEESFVKFVGLNGDSQRLYIPLNSTDPKVFECVDRTVFFTFTMTNSKGYCYQQSLKVILENCGHFLYKIKGYDMNFTEIKV